MLSKPSTSSIGPIRHVDVADNMDAMDLYRPAPYFLSIAQTAALISNLRNWGFAKSSG